MTLGGWLAGGILWHFAAMWLLVANGLVYVTLGLATGRFRRKLWPIRPGEVARDAGAALTGRLDHDLRRYNAVQKLLYARHPADRRGDRALRSRDLEARAVARARTLFGGYEGARLVHFFAMAAIVLFLVLHVVMALLVPKSLRAMITGR